MRKYARGSASSALRVARGWRQVDLAEAAGVRAESVCRIETGQVRPHRATAASIARALNVSVAELFPDEVNGGPGVSRALEYFESHGIDRVRSH